MSCSTEDQQTIPMNLRNVFILFSNGDFSEADEELEKEVDMGEVFVLCCEVVLGVKIHS